jgi:hypothetical protein
LYKFQILWENGDSANHEFVTGGYGQMIFPGSLESVSIDAGGKPCP